MEFNFVGELGSSKSLYNRALIISSYNSNIKVIGRPMSDDVVLMQQAIENLKEAKEFDCGAAGTVIRFLSLRLAQEKGLFKVRGTKRLMTRLLPQLQQTLSQLGAETRLLSDTILEIDADEWRPRGDGLWIPGGQSSQFASGILLNAWGLKQPLHFVRSGELVSDSYFQMTLDLVRNFGMVVDSFENEVSMPAGQWPQDADYEVECDVSSAFTVAALAALKATVILKTFPKDQCSQTPYL